MATETVRPTVNILDGPLYLTEWKLDGLPPRLYFERVGRNRPWVLAREPYESEVLAYRKLQQVTSYAFDGDPVALEGDYVLVPDESHFTEDAD